MWQWKERLKEPERAAMITTVTLNPSVDKLYMVEKMVPETVMRVQEVHNTAGGKGLNVARVAVLLEQKVAATGLLGGFSGGFIRSQLKEQGIQDSFIEISGETRSCINVRDMERESHTELLEPGPTVARKSLEEFLAGYRALAKSSKVITLSGSMPAGVPEDFYATLATVAKEEQCQCILDTSGTALLAGLKGNPTLIKPNEREAARLLKRSITTPEEAGAAAQAFRELGAESAAISLGEQGVVVATEQGVFWGKPPQIEPVNTVGCGDSMVAAFAVALLRKLDTQKMIELAVGVSAASALSLYTGHYNAKDLDLLLPNVKIRRLE